MVGRNLAVAARADLRQLGATNDQGCLILISAPRARSIRSAVLSMAPGAAKPAVLTALLTLARLLLFAPLCAACGAGAQIELYALANRSIPDDRQKADKMSRHLPVPTLGMAMYRAMYCAQA